MVVEELEFFRNVRSETRRSNSSHPIEVVESNTDQSRWICKNMARYRDIARVARVIISQGKIEALNELVAQEFFRLIIP